MFHANYSLHKMFHKHQSQHVGFMFHVKHNMLYLPFLSKDVSRETYKEPFKFFKTVLQY